MIVAAVAAYFSLQAVRVATAKGRPWIIMGVNDVKRLPDGRTKIVLGIVNYGQGIGWVTDAYWQEGSRELPAKPEYTGGKFLVQNRFAPFRPGLDLPFGKDDDVIVTAQRDPFFLYGYVTYRDEDSTEHSSYWCVRILPQKETYDGSVAGVSWNYVK